ncbi:serine hydrolase domain-containing protein [Microvirga puerhi]|uniref:Beta-lactamase family protein n=1 Tax=Microvirga puerhi TaxID=2876078 RepID=A0ABS7VR73_9HYPH|nr:serine hydrolase domain-containing protein [Microvirga puerhi]MBZ6078029.1 beta-lactamase family protein [Microvirga puerhi]
MDTLSLTTLPPGFSASIDNLFKSWNRPDTPGVAVGVIYRGEIVHRTCYGMADLAHAVPLEPRTVIRIASQSKQFTVLLTLMLEAEGKLSLDDDVHLHCPWLPAYNDPIKLWHLASNTSGLRDILELMILSGVPILAPSSRRLARAFVARQRKLNFRSGEDLLYSNTNFLLLSEILEQVSGKSFDELLTERITGPLGMNDTQLMPRDDVIVPRLATHHRVGPDGDWLKAAWGIAIGGEGAIVSTLDDMLRWQQNLRRPIVGTPEMFARMRTSTRLANGETVPYGLGLVNTVHHGLKGIGHGGWIAGSKSEAVFFPDVDLGIVVLANTDEIVPFELARQIADLALSRDTSISLSIGTRDQLNAASGVYRHRTDNDIFKIVQRSSGPALVTSMGIASIAEIAPSIFAPRSSIPAFTFRLEENGSITTDRFGCKLRFDRVSIYGTESDVSNCVGKYYDDDSGLAAEIREANGCKWLRLSSDIGACMLELERIDTDLFVARQGDTDIHDAWRIAPWVLPWLYTVRCFEGGIALSSDRTKNLVLHRCSGRGL